MKKTILHIKAFTLFVLLIIYNFISFPWFCLCQILGIKSQDIIRNKLLHKINVLWNILTYDK